MVSRDLEAQFLTRCVQVATTSASASTADEANLFRLAAQLVRTWYPEAASKLELSSRRFFEGHQRAQVRRFDDLVREGLVTDVSRLRSMLLHRLRS